MTRGYRGARRGGPPPPTTVRLEPGHKRTLYVVFGTLAGSGIGWLLFHHFARITTEFGEGPHPLEKWWLRLHGLAAMAALVGLGTLLLPHLHRAWQTGHNRVSGASLILTVLIVVGTGYGLYYFGGEESRPIISLVHWVLGLAVMGLLVTHVALRQRAGRARGKGREAHERRRPGTAAEDERRLHTEIHTGPEAAARGLRIPGDRQGRI